MNLIKNGVYSICENYYIFVKELNNSDDVVFFEIKSYSNNIQGVLKDMAISVSNPNDIFEYLDKHFCKYNKDDFYSIQDGYIGTVDERLASSLERLSDIFEELYKTKN